MARKGRRTPRSRGSGLLPALALFILGICLLAPVLAQAAGGSRFAVDYCDSALPGGNPLEIGWHNPNNAAYTPVQTCASPGGGFGIAETGQVTTTPAWIEVGIVGTPGGFVESLIISGAAANLQPGNEQSHICAEASCPETWPLDNAGDAPRIVHEHSEYNWFGQNGAGVNIVMACSASPCNPGGSIAAHYLVATEVDLSAPKVAAVEGTLLAGGVVRGHQTIAGEATDVGGGLSRIEVQVNGLAAAPATPGACALASVANRSYTGIVATSPTPCPARLPGSWVVNTAAPPFHEGENSVQVCASDLATVGSPNTTCTTPHAVSVNNTCTESPVSGGQNLSANFAKTNGETVTVGFGQGAEVKGQLADAAGDPIPGATICVEAQTEGAPGEPAAIATATTDAGGQFSYELPAGPNRRILIGYRHDAFQVGHTISYAAHSQPTVQLRPGRVHEGDQVQITGMLPGPSSAGRVVVLQASALHGHRWLTFRKATTGPRGGFRADYRFGKTTQTITYKIRAVVPLQNGYPYAAGQRKPARVKVQAGHRHHKRTRGPRS